MQVNENVRSMGFALKSCTTPAKGSPTFELGEDELELGVGLHGEPGRQRLKFMPANEIVKKITDAVIEDLPFICGDEVALLLNGLGGTPMGELYIAAGIVHEILRNKKIKVFRSYVNNFCTSLDMEGCSVSLLRLNEEFKRLLMAPADIPVRYF
jgi:dihydroxyacetone kinase-like protein